LPVDGFIDLRWHPELISAALRGIFQAVQAGRGIAQIQQNVLSAAHTELQLKQEHELPLAMLERLAAEGQSGELIATTQNFEIHVLLHEGRIAWATNSSSRFAFTRRLVDKYGVDKDTLREVVLECQRTRARLGEALLAWNVATREQIQDALKSQISETLTQLGELRDSRALFLPRSAAYSADLTFTLTDVNTTRNKPVAGGEPMTPT
jgi:hypothetical protein